MNELNVNYRGAELRVEFDSAPSARLFINGIQRDSSLAEETPCVIKLTSTVQTDYEWHEFIEAELRFSADDVRLRLIANNAELASETHVIERNHATG